jgi:two-component system, OmpR family, sensor kinase
MLKPHLFANKLRFSFILLTLFTVFQAGVTLWVSQQSRYHIERGRIANVLLSEFIDLGGNKQRLKVWLAQELLTGFAPPEEKNELQDKMQRTLIRLEKYLQFDRAISLEDPDEIYKVNQQFERLKTLEANILSLRSELELISQGGRAATDSREIWKFMIQVFDNLEGRDLKRLINDAIEIQRVRASQAEFQSAQSILFFKKMVYALTFLTLLTAFFLTYLILKGLKKPLEQLVKATDEMTKGNLHHRIHEIGESEFGLLANQFNRMAEEIEKSRTQEKNERKRIEKEVEDRTFELQSALKEIQLAEQKRKSFLTSVGHELKTPATVILGEAEVTLRGGIKDSQEYVETLKNIHLTSKQLSMRIEDLLVLAKDENEIFSILESELNGAEFEKLVDTASSIFSNNGKSRIAINSILSDDIKLKIDPKKIQQLIVILTDNALKYSPDKSPVEIKMSADKSSIWVEITNTAYFINDINFSKIFERYYRDEKAHLLRPDGLGVGLYIARLIVEAHQGNLEARKVSDTHFAIRFHLPRNLS